MLTYPNIDPVALKVGVFTVHWYGLMYLIGIITAWLLAVYRVRRGDIDWEIEEINDLVFYGALGVILGGRLGYILFYDFPNVLIDPLRIIRFWDGGITGMSFHGGLIGVCIALLIYTYRQKKSFWETIDFAAPLVPLGLAAGRIGNFINGELWGRVTNVPWAMVFPHVDHLPRHPSQLYEFVLEGIVLFTILWLFILKPRPTMAVSGVFAIAYGSMRFIVEFFREPDPQLGYLAFHFLTMGQLLSIPMIAFGMALLWSAYKNQKLITANNEG